MELEMKEKVDLIKTRAREEFRKLSIDREESLNRSMMSRKNEAEMTVKQLETLENKLMRYRTRKEEQNEMVSRRAHDFVQMVIDNGSKRKEEEVREESERLEKFFASMQKRNKGLQLQKKMQEERLDMTREANQAKWDKSNIQA